MSTFPLKAYQSKIYELSVEVAKLSRQRAMIMMMMRRRMRMMMVMMIMIDR